MTPGYMSWSSTSTELGCARLSGRHTNGVNVRTNNDVEGNANVVVTMLFTALISSILPSSAMVDA